MKFTKEKIMSLKDFALEPPYLYCRDELYQYIISSETGEVVYKREYAAYSKAQLRFCGNTEKGPAFYDARYSTYIYPDGDGYKVDGRIFVCPIVINSVNTVNITQGENGMGLADSFGKQIMENCYDRLRLELKITAFNCQENTEKTIPLFENSFEKEELE